MDSTTQVEVGMVAECGEPMHLARKLMETRYRTPGGKPGLRFWRGNFYQWYAGKWTMRTARWMENDLYRALENVSWVVGGAGNRLTTERCAPDSRMVTEVARAIEVVQEVTTEHCPCWLERPTNMLDSTFDPMHTVAFEDVLVDVKTTARLWDGEGPVAWVTAERTEDYFEPVVLPVNFDQDAQCPVYMEKLTEWFTEPETRELFARVSGSILLPTRKYQRGPSLIGKIRGGKGTNTNLWKKLLGGAFFGTSMRAMAGPHGLEGMQGARVIVVSECTDLESAAGQVFAGVWKNTIGRDEVTINPKNKTQIKCVLDATIVLVSNQIPKLPNKGEGMSGKMLFVPFDHSFRGAEDFDLEAKLEAELAGIARWMLEGAVRLEKERDPARKWPVGSRTQALLDQYRIVNNPFDAFLEARFVRTPEGFASGSVVRAQWNDWRQRNRVRVHVSDNQLLMKIEEESSWGVIRGRHGAEGTRGLRGMSVRRDALQGEVDDVL